MKSLPEPPRRMEGFYTIREAVEYLQCSERTVRSLVKRGVLRCLLHLRPRRISEADVHAMLVLPDRAKSRKPLTRKP